MRERRTKNQNFRPTKYRYPLGKFILLFLVGRWILVHIGLIIFSVPSRSSHLSSKTTIASFRMMVNLPPMCPHSIVRDRLTMKKTPLRTQPPVPKQETLWRIESWTEFSIAPCCYPLSYLPAGQRPSNTPPSPLKNLKTPLSFNY